MTYYTINFNNIKTYWEFYECLIKAFDFPQWCGKNPDAIWDLITAGIRVPAIIYIKGLNTLPKDLEEESNLILKIFDRAAKWYEGINYSFKVQVID